MTKVLTVRVPVVLLSQADAKATRLGLDRTQYVRQLIQQNLTDGDAVRQRGFKSEDLAGRFRLGGTSATNERVRQQLRMSELTARCRIWTVDRGDFSFYRRHGRQPIPCEFPPD